MAFHERLQGLLENAVVESPGETKSSRSVVCDAAVEDVAEEPEQLLRVRERCRRLDLARRNRGAGRSDRALLEQALLEQRAFRRRQCRQPRLDVFGFARAH